VKERLQILLENICRNEKLVSEHSEKLVSEHSEKLVSEHSERNTEENNEDEGEMERERDTTEQEDKCHVFVHIHHQ
jgi:hypothetical protein